MSESEGTRQGSCDRIVSSARICLIATVPSTFRAFYRPLINRLIEEGCELTLIASAGAELDEFEQPGRVRVFCVPITRSVSLLQDIAAIVRLVRLLRSNDFDLIHTHTPKAGLLGMIAGRVARVPYRIHTLHGLPLETARGAMRRLLTIAERVTCTLAHKVCVVSESLRQRALELRLCKPDKMLILADGTACGVDLERFDRTESVERQAADVRHAHGIPADAVVVGFVGWLVADKGVTELVDTFTTLAERRENLHLLMIGADGGDRDPLPRQTLDTIRTHSRIHYAGLVADPVPSYCAMDLCVLPTRREGFPYAVLEAGAVGIPAVATRVTGCVDAIVDGKTGLLVDANDPPALAVAIGKLAGDAGLRTALGRAARRRIETLFGSDRLVDAHVELYETPP